MRGPPPPPPPQPPTQKQYPPHFRNEYPQPLHYHHQRAHSPTLKPSHPSTMNRAGLPIVVVNIGHPHDHGRHHHHNDPATELLFGDGDGTGRTRHYYETGGGSYYYGGGLPAVVLIVFAIYALVASNTGEINAKCGDSLWKFVISSLFINFFQVFTVCIGTSIAFCMAASFGLSSERFYWVVSALGLFFVACVLGALVGVGFTITTAAMDKPLCQTALSAASFTGTPLLGIIGMVYVVIDCILLALVVLGGICVFCVLGVDGFMKSLPPPAL